MIARRACCLDSSRSSKSSSFGTLSCVSRILRRGSTSILRSSAWSASARKALRRRRNWISRPPKSPGMKTGKYSRGGGLGPVNLYTGGPLLPSLLPTKRHAVSVTCRSPTWRSSVRIHSSARRSSRSTSSNRSAGAGRPSALESASRSGSSRSAIERRYVSSCVSSAVPSTSTG